MRALVSIAAILVILAMVHIAADVVTPFLLGGALAVAFQPIAAALDRRGFPPVVAALITVTTVLTVVAMAGLMIYVACTDLVGDLPRYGESLTALKGSLAEWLSKHGFHDASASVAAYDVTGPFNRAMQSMALQLGGYARGLFFVLVVTTFFQLEGAVTRRKLARAFGGRHQAMWLEGALRDVQRYLIVKLAFSATNGILLGTWCWVCGIESPLLWGIVAFALNFVPFVGSVLAAIPPILLGLVEGGPTTALAVGSGYLAVNLLVDNVVEPRLMGRTLGLSPLVLLLAMFVWGLVLGPVGAILSVPLTMTIKLILERGDRDLRKIAMLMGNGDNAPAGSPTLS